MAGHRETLPLSGVYLYDENRAFWRGVTVALALTLLLAIIVGLVVLIVWGLRQP